MCLIFIYLTCCIDGMFQSKFPSIGQLNIILSVSDFSVLFYFYVSDFSHCLSFCLLPSACFPQNAFCLIFFSRSVSVRVFLRDHGMSEGLRGWVKMYFWVKNVLLG